MNFKKKRLFAAALLLCGIIALSGCTKAPESQTQQTTEKATIGEELPDGVTEKETAVGKGSEWELPAKITMPAEESKTAVVLVHGSGPNDMDETVYETKPFRDIAYGLADRGVAVLRYDKRTKAYGEKMSQMDLSTLTVYEETIEDAVLAAELMKEEGYERVFVAGHSLGGMLAPRIAKAAGDAVDGIIILAGSPRTLTEIQIDQNEAIIAAMTDENQIEQARKIVDAELEKYQGVMEWDEERLKTDTVFVIPGYYVKDLITNDTKKIAPELNIPILILQGEADFQVYADRDFKLWQELLGEKARYELYPNLSHLFTYIENPTGTVSDYEKPAVVAPKVIDDIAAFVKS